MPFGLTHKQLKALDPCEEEFRAVTKVLGGPRKWNGKLITAQQARDAGVSFDNIVWAASSVARSDKQVERRLRHWMADCAARVLHIFEKECPGDDRPRKAIEAARLYADGKIGVAAWDAAGDAEEAWQFDRLCEWLSDTPPEPLALPAIQKQAA
ncbi:putative immunity protein [Henriciella sp.]|uniref:putative immunity protein n=1 Tax=Henriciella sp. TaxID=1968823 RepID=UPI000C109A8A|nr:hypothetical protein [Henriciella sp.]PHR83126.1 MAG: hypothetical protein COA64_00275 [Henriciella sp.]